MSEPNLATEPTAEELRELADQLGEWQAREEAQARLLGQTYTRKDQHMPSIHDVYGSGKGLKAEDLKGRSHLLEISETRLQKFDDGPKIIIQFAGKEKSLVCNKTNAQMIASKLGDDYSEWPGNKIEVYPDKTQFNGALVDCIRVRFPLPQASGDDEIPF